MKKQNILFNLDDTLAYCNRYFNKVIDEFADHITSWFASVTREQIKQKQLYFDLEGIKKFGLKSDRFPESFAETYHYFCD